MPCIAKEQGTEQKKCSKSDLKIIFINSYAHKVTSFIVFFNQVLNDKRNSLQRKAD